MMRDTMWICVLLICLSEARSTDPVQRNLTFNVGSQVNLTCGERRWNNATFHVIWNIMLKNRQCFISNDGPRIADNCKDGKSLHNTSNFQTYLHIPNFSMDDVGIYKCEFVYFKGKDDDFINVMIRVPPLTRAWFEPKNNSLVAVCKAERGNPAANISWSHAGNVLLYKTWSESDGSVTVESQLELSEDADPSNLSCAVSHPSWDRVKIVVPETIKAANLLWLYIFIVALVVVVLVGSISFALSKVITWRRCKQPDTSSSKIPPTECVEEVEPYASYVQRVNSIYNSSADLFT